MNNVFGSGSGSSSSASASSSTLVVYMSFCQHCMTISLTVLLVCSGITSWWLRSASLPTGPSVGVMARKTVSEDCECCLFPRFVTSFF